MHDLYQVGVILYLHSLIMLLLHLNAIFNFEICSLLFAIELLSGFPQFASWSQHCDLVIYQHTILLGRIHIELLIREFQSGHQMLIMKQVIIFLLAFYDAPASRAHKISKKLGHI